MADESQGEPAAPDPVPHPQPLDYGTPDRISSAGKVFAVLGGAFMTIVVVAIVGAGLYPYSIAGVPSSTPERIHWLPVSIFLALGCGGVAGTVLLWLRRPRAAHFWFVGGVLIGLGIMGLLEGVCYARP